ncbi:MAG: adenosylcobalamin-dependent ribonucleoside-diphosphate reductase [Candidatus Woesearchaeota archaeon]
MEADKKIIEMFDFRTKHHKKIEEKHINSYKKLFLHLKQKQQKNEISFHKENNYLNNNSLAQDIYKRKYYLKDMEGNILENRPEDVFLRLASYIASVEENEEKQIEFAEKFYENLYKGYFLPGGRVIAGAGDLFRLKTLANCFVTVIEEDNIESIYNAAYDCARTYSYGGGIGVDISSLRPKDSIVHNAADKSTGAVSFMELYSLTTGLIGQSGRRGALMLTIDVKHPDVMDFINVKQNPSWITKQIVDQCKWSNKFNDEQLIEVEKQVRENTQVRFANISLKVSDEFMMAVDETKKFKEKEILVYKKLNKDKHYEIPQSGETHYSYKIPSKDITKYEFIQNFDSIESLNKFLQKYNGKLNSDELNDVQKRDVFGDYIISTNEEYDLAIHYTGDFLTYFGSDNTKSTKNLINANELWSSFVTGNYNTAEPGLIFWDTMRNYSPSDYMGKKISSTNPCGEIPLEDGGACNLASLNLSRFVNNGYTNKAEIDWDNFDIVVKDLVRFLDNVITWNIALNPLKKQRDAAKDTRRLGIGLMGIADMLNQLGLGYDSEKSLNLIEEFSKRLANNCYIASSEIAKEKEPIPIWDYEKYSKCPFFIERLDDNVKELVKKNGLRNIALLSIAPTGTISNVILGYSENNKNYIGVSGGIEPIFALYYTRRSEQMNEGAFYKVFHSTVQAYIDKYKLNDKVKNVNDINEIKKILPEHFFRTSHYINPLTRVKIQGLCQKYIDHSISSTVNLPESISPEVISEIYLDAWKEGLKGITIYRDGSRYPILSVQQEMTEFQEFKKKTFKVYLDKIKEMKGDEVFLYNNKLTTPFHAIKQGIKVEEIDEEGNVKKNNEDNNNQNSSGKACKVEFVNGKLVKNCGD